MSPQLTIVDYGMGNLGSVDKAFRQLDYQPQISDEPDRVNKSDILVVPGVGAFDRAVTNLRDNGLWEPVLNHLEQSRPYLGICLGLQLLFEGSAEGDRSGLGVYAGDVVRFTTADPVPHMGWNDVRWNTDRVPFIEPGAEQMCYYFVHSFYPQPEDSSIVAGASDYGSEFCAVIQDDNRVGIQFHPEKSQQAGLQLLDKIMNFFLSEV